MSRKAEIPPPAPFPYKQDLANSGEGLQIELITVTRDLVHHTYIMGPSLEP